MIFTQEPIVYVAWLWDGGVDSFKSIVGTFLTLDEAKYHFGGVLIWVKEKSGQWVAETPLPRPTITPFRAWLEYTAEE